MRNISRRPEPVSLVRRKKRWTDELLAKIKEHGDHTEDVPDRYYTRYNKSDVKAALDLMYRNYCCYCEGRIGIVDYPHIEHRKPKRGPHAYPELTFEWDNLHLACTKCNGHKGDRYDEAHPILDAVHDVPISKYLSYQIYGDGVWRKAQTLRGKTTEQHANLNRPELVNARREVLTDALNLIAELNTNASSPDASMTRKQLDALLKEQFGSVIEYAIETFLIPSEAAT